MHGREDSFASNECELLTRHPDGTYRCLAGGDQAILARETDGLPESCEACAIPVVVKKYACLYMVPVRFQRENTWQSYYLCR